jgi:hypothetical protein
MTFPFYKGNFGRARSQFTGEKRIAAGEKRHFSFSQRPEKTLAAAAANIGSGRGNHRRRSLRTEFLWEADLLPLQLLNTA